MAHPEATEEQKSNELTKNLELSLLQNLKKEESLLETQVNEAGLLDDEINSEDLFN